MRKVIPTFVVFIASITFASAAYYDLADGLGYGMQQLIWIVESVLGPLFSVFLGGTGDLLFERILFLFIVFSVVYVVLKSDNVKLFKDQPTIVWIISIAVSLMATRFLSDTAIVQTMILPYSVLGVALTSGIPLLIYFYFVQGFEDSSVMRKSLWVLFMVVFFGLWGSRYNDLGDISWIYFITAILSLIFFFFDGTIMRIRQKQQLEHLKHNTQQEYIAEIHKRLEELEKSRIAGHVTKRFYREQRKRLQEQMKFHTG